MLTKTTSNRVQGMFSWPEDGKFGHNPTAGPNSRLGERKIRKRERFHHPGEMTGAGFIILFLVVKYSRAA